MIGFLISARLPAIRQRVYVPESAVDKFAVTIACDSDESSRRAESILREAGAEAVRSDTEQNP